MGSLEPRHGLAGLWGSPSPSTSPWHWVSLGGCVPQVDLSNLSAGGSVGCTWASASRPAALHRAPLRWHEVWLLQTQSLPFLRLRHGHVSDCIWFTRPVGSVVGLAGCGRGLPKGETRSQDPSIAAIALCSVWRFGRQ